MGRRRRPLLRFVVYAALALAALAASLWVRGQFKGDVWIASSPGGWYGRVLSVGGSLTFEAAPHCPYHARGLRWHSFPRGAFQWEPPTIVASDGREWIATPYSGEQPKVAAVSVSVPHALIAAAGAAPAAALTATRRARRARRRRRAARGLCAECGYGLRGTPARCPECGASPPPT